MDAADANITSYQHQSQYSSNREPIYCHNHTCQVYHAAMSTLDQELLSLTEKVASALELPQVERVVLPDKMLSVSEARAKHDKFGVVVLGDGNAGFFYRLLDVNPEQIERYRSTAVSLQNRPLLEAAALLQSDDAFHRALALGAINAATRALFETAGFELPAKPATGGTATTAQSERPIQTSVGMVGYFRQQVSTLRAQGYRVVVLELNPDFHQSAPDLLVSNDIASLDGCERIYCTASTLINNTLEGLLAHFSALPRLPHIEIVGPSAGCFPDALFTRGAAVVGGSIIKDTQATCDRIRCGEPWLDAASKFSLPQSAYPGVEELIKRATC